MVFRGRFLIENDLLLFYGVFYDFYFGMGDVQRGFLDNLYFFVDDRYIDWNEKYDI